MLTRLLPVALALLAAVAMAGEAEKPAPKPKPKEAPALPTPTEDEMDKPTKRGAPAPAPIPADEPAAAPEKENEKGPAPKHVNPFGQRAKLPPYARPARITYSDGAKLEGYVWAGAKALLRIFDRAERAHQDYPFAELKRIDVKPETENFEADWRWKNQGSSEKVFLETGYLWNQYVTTFTLSDGSKPSGDCSGQFYIQTLDGKKDKWYLYKRQSGGDDRTKPHKKRAELEPLVYIKSVEFTDDFLKKTEEIKNP